MKEAVIGFALVTLILYLSACGFQPAYSTYGNSENQSNARQQLSTVQIGIIPNREGQLLRNELIDRFYTNGTPASPRYILSVSPLTITERDLDITVSSDTTRAELRAQTRFTLTDAISKKVLVQDTAISFTSYNVLGSEFATRVSENSALENALDDIASKIERALVYHINKPSGAQ